MKNVFHKEEIDWGPHAKVKGGKSTTLFTKAGQNAQATVGMVVLPKGSELPWHDHGRSDDIIFVLGGSAEIEMEGIGVFPMKEGSHILVPGLNRHRIFNISEDLKLYHVKAPAAS